MDFTNENKLENLPQVKIFCIHRSHKLEDELSEFLLSKVTSYSFRNVLLSVSNPWLFLVLRCIETRLGSTRSLETKYMDPYFLDRAETNITVRRWVHIRSLKLYLHPELEVLCNLLIPRMQTEDSLHKVFA